MKSENIYKLIDRLEEKHSLERNEWTDLLENGPGCPLGEMQLAEYAAAKAVSVRKKVYGNEIFIRGLIEFTNCCRNDCYYCGIRKSNTCISRYRLTEEEILSCCARGYGLGFRTFVLQGGEDPFFDDDRICRIVSDIKKSFPDCAVTLSIGEKSKDSYQAYFNAGADRFLLRHETADEGHYRLLHPAGMSLENRKRCLEDLKEIGFQTGAGFMVGSPGQTPETIAQDMMFLNELKPQMVGIGPFIPHRDTPLAGEKAGTWQQTCFLLSLIRLMLPDVLLPATTALGTIIPGGRQKGILSGANVVMPNLSPEAARDKYILYDNKLNTGTESGEHLEELKREMEILGYRITTDRGDHRSADRI